MLTIILIKKKFEISRLRRSAIYNSSRFEKFPLDGRLVPDLAESSAPQTQPCCFEGTRQTSPDPGFSNPAQSKLACWACVYDIAGRGQCQRNREKSGEAYRPPTANARQWCAAYDVKKDIQY